MTLYWCQYYSDEWGLYIIAETRNKARALFYKDSVFLYACDGAYRDVQCLKMCDAGGYEAATLEPGDSRLAELGCEYLYIEHED
jgi:hypothetical protein